MPRQVVVVGENLAPSRWCGRNAGARRRLAAAAMRVVKEGAVGGMVIGVWWGVPVVVGGEIWLLIRWERRPDSRPMTALAMTCTLTPERERRKASSRTSLAMSRSDTARGEGRGTIGFFFLQDS